MYQTLSLPFQKWLGDEVRNPLGIFSKKFDTLYPPLLFCNFQTGILNLVRSKVHRLLTVARSSGIPTAIVVHVNLCVPPPLHMLYNKVTNLCVTFVHVNYAS